MMELFKYDKDDATTSSMTEITGSFCFGGTDDLYWLSFQMMMFMKTVLKTPLTLYHHINFMVMILDL